MSNFKTLSVQRAEQKEVEKNYPKTTSLVIQKFTKEIFLDNFKGLSEDAKVGFCDQHTTLTSVDTFFEEGDTSNSIEALHISKRKSGGFDIEAHMDIPLEYSVLSNMSNLKISDDITYYIDDDVTDWNFIRDCTFAIYKGNIIIFNKGVNNIKTS